MVLALKPVSVYDFAPTPAVPTWVHGPLAVGPRRILNPDSFEELSCQFKLIWLEEPAVAPRFEGAAGTVALPPPLLAALAGTTHRRFKIAKRSRNRSRVARPQRRARRPRLSDRMAEVSAWRFIV